MALWNILLKQEIFSSLKYLKYEDLFINYNGATPTQTHSLWISKAFKNGIFTESQIYAINSGLPCDMLIQSTTAHLQHIYYNSPWKISGFQSKDTILNVINRVKTAAQEHNIHIIKDLFKEFPITITCNKQPKFSATTFLDVHSIEKLQTLWKVFLTQKKFIPLKTLSYDKLFIHNRGITSIEYPNLWITEFNDGRSSWNPKYTQSIAH